MFLAKGREWLSENWKLCTPLMTKKNVTKLKNWASELYVNLAMINYPYPANFLTPLPANPVKVKTMYLELLYKFIIFAILYIGIKHDGIC